MGAIKPSVTQVLEASGISDFSGVDPAVLQYAQERGTAVHVATHLDDENDLDESTLDPEIGGYLEGWRKLRRDRNFRPRLIEQLVYRRITLSGADSRVPDDSDTTIVGKFDREGFLAIIRDAIVDIKTGEETEAWRVQLAAYVRGFSRTAQWTHERVIAQLRRNGNYKIIVYPRADFDRDWMKFRDAAMAVKGIVCRP